MDGINGTQKEVRVTLVAPFFLEDKRASFEEHLKGNDRMGKLLGKQSGNCTKCFRMGMFHKSISSK